MNGDEKERREAALAAMGGEVLDARAVRPREVRQMLSVRMEPQLIADLREVAEARNEKVSDVLRDAAVRVVAEHRAQDVHITTWFNAVSTLMQPTFVVSTRTGLVQTFATP